MRTALYRHYDIDDNLLYIGLSSNLPARIRGHQDTSRWFENVRAITVEWFDTREETCVMETKAINEENPFFNKAKVFSVSTKGETAEEKNEHLRKQVRGLKQDLKQTQSALQHQHKLYDDLYRKYTSLKEGTHYARLKEEMGVE